MISNSINRRSFLAKTALISAAPFMPGILAGTRGMQPNIIYILSDDQGLGDCSTYGFGDDILTPNIDKIASEGMLFNNFYSNSPVCSPTRAGFLSGKSPDLVGVPGVIRTNTAEGSYGCFHPGTTTVANSLKDIGYNTACIGKWHLGLEDQFSPNSFGFDHFHGFLGDKMDSNYTYKRHGNNYMRLNDQVINENDGLHATDLFTGWVEEYIQTHAQLSDPFFLFIPFNAPHRPLESPQEYVDRVKSRNPGIDENRAQFVAMVEHMDDAIGRILNTIEAQGIKDNTLVVFTSDNGGNRAADSNNGPYNNYKGTMYEGGIRVPACVMWPGQIQPGSVSDYVAITMDLFPTFCETAGANIPSDIQGRSFLPELQGQVQDTSDRLLIFVRREGKGVWYGARKGDWKLVQEEPDEGLKLFNLKDDPYETTNLGTSHPQYQPLYNEFMEHRAIADTVPWQCSNLTNHHKYPKSKKDRNMEISVKGYFFPELIINNAENGLLLLTNLQGKQILRKQIAGSDKLHITLKGLSSGIYIAKIFSKGKQNSYKFRI